MTSWSLLILFLVLQLFSISSLYAEQSFKTTTVSVVNGLPKALGDVQVECGLGPRNLKAGDRYQFRVGKARKLQYCESEWRGRIASWHAFQPKRDASHETVFWLVKEDGFFLSWDNSTWIRRSKWESE